MDDILLLEAVERYLSGEMPAQEKVFFEDLRKKNADVDQMVVEHTYFLQGLDKYGSTRSFKNSSYFSFVKFWLNCSLNFGIMAYYFAVKKKEER